jgi:hypothetical protein
LYHQAEKGENEMRKNIRRSRKGKDCQCELCVSQNDIKKEIFVEHSKEGLTINITINNTINIGNKEIHIEQRAEGGGQINKNVGVNANQGGQNALDHSKTQNNKSQFADGNGRSGIAGDDNDEAGGQQGIKIRDSKLRKTRLKSNSSHSEAQGQPEETGRLDA